MHAACGLYSKSTSQSSTLQRTRVGDVQKSRFGASCSQHPIPSIAVGEAVGDVLEQLGAQPDLVVVAMTPDLTGTFEDVVGVVRSVLKPSALLATTSASVQSNATSVDQRQGISLWAGRVGRVSSFHVDATANDEFNDDAALEDLAARLAREVSGATGMLVLGDPFSFPAESFLEMVNQRWPGLPVTGGTMSAARRPGGGRLAVNHRVMSGGAIGVVMYDHIPSRRVSSHACSPIGPTMTVTKSERRVVYELNGQPAKAVFDSVANSLDEAGRRNLRGGVYLGVNTDPGRSAFDPEGDTGRFFICNVVGFDRSSGALGLDGETPVGASVRFHTQVDGSVGSGFEESVAAATAAASVGSTLLFNCSKTGIDGSLGGSEILANVHELTNAPVSGVSCSVVFGHAGNVNMVQRTGASALLFG